MDVSGSVYTLPANLPVPVDDGAADHLRGAAVPALELPATSGRAVSLAALARQPAVLFFSSVSRWRA